jgi:hypothetical protein
MPFLNFNKIFLIQALALRVFWIEMPNTDALTDPLSLINHCMELLR